MVNTKWYNQPRIKILFLAQVTKNSELEWQASSRATYSNIHGSHVRGWMCPGLAVTNAYGRERTDRCETELTLSIRACSPVYFRSTDAIHLFFLRFLGNKWTQRKWMDLFYAARGNRTADCESCSPKPLIRSNFNKLLKLTCNYFYFLTLLSITIMKYLTFRSFNGNISFQYLWMYFNKDRHYVYTYPL